MKNPVYKHHYLVECLNCHRVIGFYEDWHKDNQEPLEKSPDLACPQCFVKAITHDELYWQEVTTPKRIEEAAKLVREEAKA